MDQRKKEGEFKDSKEILKLVRQIEEEMGKIVVGQKEIVRGVIRAILCNGHVLIEGVPGIAKTLVVKSMAKIMGCDAKRIQFTVDLLPTDITGIMSYSPEKGFEVVKGPIFTNFVIADEINRSPPKCVLGDTPVILANGQVIEIRDAVRDYSGESRKEGNEEWIKLKKPLKLMALDLNDYKIKPEEVSYLYKQKTNSPYFDVELKSGRKIKTSPVHPFFTLRNGRVQMIRAEELRGGDCVLTPRKLDIISNNKLNYNSEAVKTSEGVFNEIKRRKEVYLKIQELRSSGLGKKETAENLNLLATDSLFNTFWMSRPEYLDVDGNRFFSKSKQFGQVSSVKKPEEVTKELAQLMAILISEGCVNGSYFYITMKEREVLELFIRNLYSVFGLKANLLYDNIRNQYRVAFRSDALVSLLKAIGFNPHFKSGEKEIPQFIMQSSDEIVKEFLKLYYEGDGCVSRDCVKVTTKSRKIANNLSYLLLRMGFAAKINRELSKTYIGNYRYCRKFYNVRNAQKIRISEHPKNPTKEQEGFFDLRMYGGNLKRFSEEIGFFSKEKNDKLTGLIKNINEQKTDLIPGMHEMIRAMRKISGITHKEFFQEVGMHAHNVGNAYNNCISEHPEVPNKTHTLVCDKTQELLDLENPNNSLMHSRYRLGKISTFLTANNYLAQQLGKIVDSDFACDFVKKADKIIPKEDYWLYDFSMKDNHSFIAGFGGIISHNTQSALLEAMQENAVSIARQTYPLPKPFFVMATENPIEVSGVYSLPEAQTDRFLFKLLMGYPTTGEETAILTTNTSLKNFEDYDLKKVLSPAKIIELQKKAKEVFSSDEIKNYIVRIVDETRSKDFEYSKYISYGASPRAAISIYIASKAEALINGRNYVLPKDVRAVACAVIRHRIVLNYEAEADKITTDMIVEKILDKVKAP